MRLHSDAPPPTTTASRAASLAFSRLSSLFSLLTAVTSTPVSPVSFFPLAPPLAPAHRRGARASPSSSPRPTAAVRVAVAVRRRPPPPPPRSLEGKSALGGTLNEDNGEPFGARPRYDASTDRLCNYAIQQSSKVGSGRGAVAKDSARRALRRAPEPRALSLHRIRRPHPSARVPLERPIAPWVRPRLARRSAISLVLRSRRAVAVVAARGLRSVSRRGRKP